VVTELEVKQVWAARVEAALGVAAKAAEVEERMEGLVVELGKEVLRAVDLVMGAEAEATMVKGSRVVALYTRCYHNYTLAAPPHRKKYNG
jgi:hypothetical protein